VSDPDAPPLNAGAILRALIDHQVDFVLVGGRAAQGHGAIRPTKDLDICPAWNDANLARVIAALRHLGAQMKMECPRGRGHLIAWVCPARREGCGVHAQDASAV